MTKKKGAQKARKATARAATRPVLFRLPVTLLEELDRHVEELRELDPMTTRATVVRNFLAAGLRSARSSKA